MDFWIVAMSSPIGDIAELHSWGLFAVAAALAIVGFVVLPKSVVQAGLTLMLSAALIVVYLMAGKAAERQFFDPVAAAKVGDVGTVQVLHRAVVKSADEAWTVFARVPSPNGKDVCVAQVGDSQGTGQQKEIEAEPQSSTSRPASSGAYKFHKDGERWVPDQVSQDLTAQSFEAQRSSVFDCAVALRLFPKTVSPGVSRLTTVSTASLTAEPEANPSAVRVVLEEIRKQVPRSWVELSRTEMSTGADTCQVGLAGLKGTELSYAKATPLSDMPPLSGAFQFKKEDGTWRSLYVSPKFNDFDRTTVERLVKECVSAIQVERK